MCYYDSWFEENWCEEPRKEETALIEAIKENVRQDIKAEMERLRKEQKTQTNADKIRSMTDEELAVFLDEFSGRCVDCEELGPDTGCPIYKRGVFCLPCDVMDWLKQPADEE